MFAPIPPKNYVSFPQEKKTLSENFWNVKVLKSMFFLLTTREVFITKLLSQNHKSALFWLIFFLAKILKFQKIF